MKDDFQIRKSLPSDFLSIASLDREAWLSNAHHEFIPDGEHAWRIWCEYALCYVAEQSSNIIGAILAFKCESGEYCVHKVFVHPSNRGKGIGSALFNILLEKTDKMRVSSFLTVDPNNIHALSLYQSWGYHKSELIEGFYRPEEHRYIMSRSSKA